MFAGGKVINKGPFLFAFNYCKENSNQYYKMFFFLAIRYDYALIFYEINRRTHQINKYVDIKYLILILYFSVLTKRFAKKKKKNILQCKTINPTR